MANSQYTPGGTWTGLSGTCRVNDDPLWSDTFMGRRRWSRFVECVAAPVLIREKVWLPDVSIVTTIVPPGENVDGFETDTISGRTAGPPVELSKYGGVRISKSGWFWRGENQGNTRMRKISSVPFAAEYMPSGNVTRTIGEL
jgi:hypothetical protein